MRGAILHHQISSPNCSQLGVLICASRMTRGVPHILRVRPRSYGLAGTSPVVLRSALSSLEIGANFFAVAHADGVVRQSLMRASTGMVCSGS